MSWMKISKPLCAVLFVTLAWCPTAQSQVQAPQAEDDKDTSRQATSNNTGPCCQIPNSERQALINLYNTTDGPNWNFSTGWLGPPGTECSWLGVECRGDVNAPRVWEINLPRRNLSGPFPDVTAFAELSFLFLQGNKLTGSIPDLSSLTQLGQLWLGSNQLSGTIPPSLQNLPLRANSGGAGLLLRNNRLDITQVTPSLEAFLDSQTNGSWKLQTVPPQGVTVLSTSASTATIGWMPTPLATVDLYTVLASRHPGGPYIEGGTTTVAGAVQLTVTGLAPATNYYFVVRTETPAIFGNPVGLVSDLSDEVSAVTIPLVPDPIDEIQTDAPPSQPMVFDDPNGGYGVVWTEMTNGQSRLKAQLFDASGQAATNAFAVAETGRNQANPDADWSGNGKFGIVWESSSSAEATLRNSLASGRGGIFGRFFSSTGTAQTGVVALSSASASQPSGPKISLDKNGGAITTWSETEGVIGRLVDAAGSPAPTTMAIDPSASGASLDAASQASGDFVVVWSASGSGPTGSILGRVFDQQGQPKTAPFSATSEPSAANPAVTASDAGDFVVVWSASGGPGGPGIFGRFFDAAAQPAPDVLSISQAATEPTGPLGVDGNAAGDFVVTWSSSASAATPTAAARSSLFGPQSSIFGRFFTAGAQPFGSQITVATSEGSTQPAEPSVSLDNRDQATVVFTKRHGNMSEGLFKTTIRPRLAAGTCTSSNQVMCLGGSRFRVSAQWRNDAGASGMGTAVPLTSDTGTFWFFDADNLEIVVKVLDACSINGHYWVFAGGLTNVEVNLIIDDAFSGQTVTYFNPQGTSFAPVQDSTALPVCP